jgi:hypothetical protein
VSDFKVITKDSSISLTKEELFRTILESVYQDKDNQSLRYAEEYSEVILSILGATTNKEFYNLSFKQLATISFMSGYYYKLFLSKNNVTIIDRDSEEGSN